MGAIKPEKWGEDTNCFACSDDGFSGRRVGLDRRFVKPGGPGRPVVLIHGWPLSSASWKAQTPFLAAAGFRVVAYDRREFGQSDKPWRGFDYDTLAEDLDSVLTELGLTDATLVGFSMGGGEVARYITKHGVDRIRSVVFASAVPPYLLRTDDNPDGPLTEAHAAQMTKDLTEDEDVFYDQFTKQFFSFGTTDFRDDLVNVTVPTLVIHGDGDGGGTVPFEGSGKRTHQAITPANLSSSRVRRTVATSATPTSSTGRSSTSWSGSSSMDQSPADMVCRRGVGCSRYER